MGSLFVYACGNTRRLGLIKSIITPILAVSYFLLYEGCYTKIYKQEIYKNGYVPT